MTEFVAVISLGISCLVFGWTLYRDLTNTGWLRVQCYLGRKVIPVPEGENIIGDTKIVFLVTNIGRQPIFAVEIGGKYKRDKKHDFLIVNESLPKMLKPGEYLFGYAELELLENELEFLCVKDSLGKVYKVKRRELKKLIASYRGGA